VIDLVGNENGKNWRFTLEHANIAFEAPLDSNDAYSRSVDTASGGEAGGKAYSSVANSEQN
jgi:hypothetical protein